LVCADVDLMGEGINAMKKKIGILLVGKTKQGGRICFV
jgi:hypothetical protein